MVAKFGLAIQTRSGDMVGLDVLALACKTGAHSFTHCEKNSKLPSASVIKAVGV